MSKQNSGETMELSTVPSAAVSERADPAPPSVGLMLQAALDKGVTAENVAVLEKMMNLYERTQAKEAEKAFARAFNALQAEMPAIRAVKPVPDRDGNVKYHFAPFESIMEEVRPFLLKHGFAVSFSMTADEGRVTQTCKLTHVDGHSQANSSSVRIGKGPPGATETQADGAASTYAKRFALCDALNIVIERDSDGSPPLDARVIGAPISPDKVVYLKELVKETNSDEGKFLAFARVKKYEDIGEADYPRLVAALEKKRT